MTIRRRQIATAVAIGTVALTAAGCGSTSSSPSGVKAAADTTASGSSVYASVPSGTTLNVGDQQQEYETLFKDSGVESQLPFKINWVEFDSGPLVSAGFASNRIDLGQMGDLPAALTVSSKLPVKAAIISHAVGSDPDEFFIAKPGITSISDLKGKSVAYTTGTHEQAFALESLAEGGLDQSDVKQANVSLEQLFTVLESGSVDAAVIDGVPDEKTYLSSHPGAKVLETNLTVKPTSYSYWLATTKALGNSTDETAIKDFAKGLEEAYNWANSHKQQWATDYYVDVQHDTQAAASEGADAAVNTQYVPYSSAVSAAMNDVVRLETQAGAIKSAFSVSTLFSDSSWLSGYAASIKQVSQSAS